MILYVLSILLSTPFDFRVLNLLIAKTVFRVLNSDNHSLLFRQCRTTGPFTRHLYLMDLDSDRDGT